MLMDNTQKHVSNGSTILYGVPKVHYGAFGGITPLAIAIKAAANYMGMELNYNDAIVYCGAAFRITWNETCWDGGNVGDIFAFDDPAKVFRLALTSLGCEYNLIERTSTTKKSDFANFMDVAGNVTFDESGYYITDKWWENPDTNAVMSLGEPVREQFTVKAIVENTIEVMTPRRHGDYAKAGYAYDAWKKAILNNNDFSKNMISPLLVERLMCQGDAMDCISGCILTDIRTLKKGGTIAFDAQAHCIKINAKTGVWMMELIQSHHSDILFSFGCIIHANML